MKAARRATPDRESLAPVTWWHRAACGTLDFLGWCDGDPTYAPQALKDVCDECPVRRECLIDALRNRDECVRAGLTKKQRDMLLRPRKRSSCPVCSSRLPVAVDDMQVCPGCGVSWRTMRRKVAEGVPIAVSG